MNAKLFKTPSDFRRSLETRIKTVSREKGIDLQGLRRKVAFERLLARIFHESTRDFVLKGGYAMELRFMSARATKDIDLSYLQRGDAIHFSQQEIITRSLHRITTIDLEDYFSFKLSDPIMELTNAPYGGARYAVSSLVDSREFVRFQLDIGGDVVVDRIEECEAMNWLEFCGVPSPKIQMISVEQQFAEKIHAYLLPRDQGENTRTKDLVDMLLLIKLRQIDKGRLSEVLRKVYAIRGAYQVPSIFKPPPEKWLMKYKTLARECGLNQSMSEAYQELKRFYEALDFS